MTLFTRAWTEAAQKSQVWTVFASIFQFQLTCRGVEVLAILIILCSDSRRPARVSLLYVDKIQSFNEKIKKIVQLTRRELDDFILCVVFAAFSPVLSEVSILKQNIQ